MPSHCGVGGGDGSGDRSGRSSRLRRAWRAAAARSSSRRSIMARTGRGAVMFRCFLVVKSSLWQFNIAIENGDL